MEDARRRAARTGSDVTATPESRLYVNTSLSSTSNEEAEPPDLGPLTTKDLVCFAFQIARGMDYLASRKVSQRSRPLTVSLKYT